MAEQEFGPLRSKAARKPWPECPDIVVYRCCQCAKLYQGLDYQMPSESPTCCDTLMERLEPLVPADVAPEIMVDYKIVGGFNQSAVQVFWETKQSEVHPDWVLLKTFTGSYIKYIASKKRTPAVFPLSDEDAYVYCDRSICQECLFRCKRGFIIYLYFKNWGLVEVPLEKMSAYFKP